MVLLKYLKIILLICLIFFALSSMFKHSIYYLDPKLFSDLYLAKFLDTLAKLFFTYIKQKKDVNKLLLRNI